MMCEVNCMNCHVGAFKHGLCPDDFCEKFKALGTEDDFIKMMQCKTGKWIPCSERLPEDWVPVLVTLKKPERLPAWIKAKPENYFHIVDADVCENGEWSVNKKNVTAWMPLPEPYKEGEQNEID